MYSTSYIQKCLFFDIETVGRYNTFDDFYSNESGIANIWLEKASQSEKYKSDPKEAYEKYAGLYPEYGKVVCICFGYWDIETDKWAIEEMSIEDSSEEDMLEEFAARINKDFRNHILSGFNIKNFDIPYLYRRMLVHGILPPGSLDLCEKKPWDIKAYDLYKVWSDSGSINGMCSFELVCLLMGIQSPKDGEVNGKNVSDAYFNGDISNIVKYCRKDVLASIKMGVMFCSDVLKEPGS